MAINDSGDEMRHLSPEDKQELLDAIEAHFQTYLRARSLTPSLQKSIVDEIPSNQPRGFFLISTSPLYHDYGYSCHIIHETGQFDTEEKYRQYQDIGHWINQSFFIELKCILDTFITDWSKCPLKDDKYFRLLEKCRHLFAHSSYQLDYKSDNDKRVKQNMEAISLYKELFWDLGQPETGLNLSISEFVIPFYRKLVDELKTKL